MLALASCATTTTGRTINDANYTGPVLISASANFSPEDVGKKVKGPDIQIGTRIKSIENSTTVLLTKPALFAHAGETIVLMK